MSALDDLLSNPQYIALLDRMHPEEKAQIMKYIETFIRPLEGAINNMKTSVESNPVARQKFLASLKEGISDPS
jgi:hypothetical protein